MPQPIPTYHDPVILSTGKLWEIGAFQQWTKGKADDPVFKEYRREYKRRFAWIKAGKLTAEEFYLWSEQARAKKKACDDGTLSLDAFKAWLKQS